METGAENLEISSALKQLGYTSSEELLAGEAELKAQGLIGSRQVDKRVCLCGHGISRHSEYEGVVTCSTNKMNCPCLIIRPVLKVDDTRLFKMKTYGSGSKHALIRGMIASAKLEKNVEWLVDLVCENPSCKKTGVTAGIEPTPLTKSRQTGMTQVQTDFDMTIWTDHLLCKECRDQRA